MRATGCLCGMLLLMGAGLLSDDRLFAADSASIYKCEIGGVLTFSDRPCSSHAELHELDDTAVNTYSPPPPAATASKPKPAVKKSVSHRGGSPEDKRAETCLRVGRSMKEVRSKMRTGYSAREGERLRERLARLKDQQRESRCS